MPSLNTKLASAPNTSSNYVLKATSSTTIGNSLIWDNGTNVGVGNTNTTYTFDVTGTGRFTGALTGTSATFSGGDDKPLVLASTNASNLVTEYKYNTSTTIAYIGNETGLTGGGSSGNFAIRAQNGFAITTGGATTRLTITSGGNVGIGTSSPASVLEIAGTPIVGDALTGIIQLVTNNSTAYNSSPQSGIAFQFKYNSGGSVVTGGGINGLKENSTSGDYATALGFYTRANGGNITERMRITSGGNVGIGTATPASQSTGQTAGIVDITASGGGNLVLHRNGSSDTALFSILKASNGTYIDSTGAATASNNAIYFRTNNNNADQTTVNTALTITSAGNVVVANSISMPGTSAQLLQTTSNSVAGDNVMVLYNSNANSYGVYIGAGSGTNHALYITDYSRNNPLFKVQGNGNVLVGTSSDYSYKFAVASGTQYLGGGFQVSPDITSSGTQAATTVINFSGTSPTFDLASLFPRTTFTNRGLCITMQLVAQPTYTIVSAAYIVIARTGNSNVWSSTILANLNINGAAVNSVSGSGTTITVNYSTYIFGTAYINIATTG